MREPAHRDLSRLLDAGLDLPESQRAGWISELPAQFDGLKPRLRNLLLSGPSADFLDTLPKLALCEAQASREAPGTCIGNYRLERLLGEGGMASVWLAKRSDGLIDRPVALKIPHGIWQRTELAQRMARERAILATLNHPNIAKLYDAGLTADGKPYLALEYLEGLRIDAYCQTHQLDVRDRLRLFEQMANAVAYSHAKLVLHRDLKPANILVAQDGQIRLLDFGIARLLDSDESTPSALTEVTGRVLTLDYASPEQISGAPVSVASDIYSLGVVLYELLTGVRPCQPQHESRAALEQAILRAEPRLPSEVANCIALRRTLRGDLDSVILKALRKQPTERYATANELAEDVRRYLDGHPVRARSGNTWYRLQRFVSRNKVSTAACAGVLLAASIGASVALWQARVALLERTRAQGVTEFVISLLQQTNPYTRKDGAPISAADILTGAREQVERELSQQPQVSLALLASIAESFAGHGRDAEAARILEQALGQTMQASVRNSPAFVRAHRILSQAYYELGRNEESRRSLDLALAAPPGRRPGTEAALLQLQKSALAVEDAQFDAALQAARAALRLAQSSGEANAQVLAQAWRYEAVVHRARGDAPRAIEGYRRAYDLALRAYGNDGRHPFVMETRVGYARALMMQSRWREAIVHLRAAVDAATQTFGPEAAITGNFLGSLGDVQAKLGDIDAGVANCRKALAIYEDTTQKETRGHAASLRLLGRALLAARQYSEAAELLGYAVTMRASLNDPYELPAIRAPYALALIHLGRLDEAQAQLASIAQSGDKVPRASVIEMLLYRGILHRHREDYSLALTDLNHALTLAKSTPDSQHDQAQILSESARLQMELGRHDRALAEYSRAAELFRQTQWRITPAMTEALEGAKQASLCADQPARCSSRTPLSTAGW
jgi:serine/threonine protein kinase